MKEGGKRERRRLHFKRVRIRVARKTCHQSEEGVNKKQVGDLKGQTGNRLARQKRHTYQLGKKGRAFVLKGKHSGGRRKKFVR